MLPANGVATCGEGKMHVGCIGFSWLLESALGLGFSLRLWAVAFGHSSGLLPLEAPVMIAENRKNSCSFPAGYLACLLTKYSSCSYDSPPACLQICN